MFKLLSAYPGTLVLPSGAEIAAGAEVEVPADVVENAGVASWIKDGFIIATEVEAAPEPNIDSLTVEELKALLTDRGVEIPSDAKKADLVALAKA